MNYLFKTFKKSRLFCLVLILLLVWQSKAYAQRFQGGFGLMVINPQSEFSKNIGDRKIGGSGWIGYQFKNSPVMAGIDFSYFMYGRSSRSDVLSQNVSEVLVNVTTTNNLISLHPFIRLLYKKGFLHPYADVFVGFNYLYNRTSVKDKGRIGETIASATVLSDVVLSYGFGTGVMFSLFNNFDRYNVKNPFEIALDLRFRYFFGGEAEYLQKSTLVGETENITHLIQKSQTDMKIFQLGLVFKF